MLLTASIVRETINHLWQAAAALSMTKLIQWTTPTLKTNKTNKAFVNLCSTQANFTRGRA